MCQTSSGMQSHRTCLLSENLIDWFKRSRSMEVQVWPLDAARMPHTFTLEACSHPQDRPAMMTHTQYRPAGARQTTHDDTPAPYTQGRPAVPCCSLTCCYMVLPCPLPSNKRMQSLLRGDGAQRTAHMRREHACPLSTSPGMCFWLQALQL